MPLIAPQREQRPPRHLGERWNIDPVRLVAAIVVMGVSAAVLAWSVASPVVPDTARVTAPIAASAVATEQNAPSATPVPVVTTTTTTSPPVVWSTTSTMYCEHTQPTKSGTQARDGVVAVSPGNYDRLLGTTWKVLDGPLAGKVVHVEDMGPAADFDMFTFDCPATHVYGRQPIHVQQVHTR